MCTVTFVPTETGFVFTSNRDEDPSRAANKIVEDQRGDSKVFFPQDEGASGTWFAYSNTDQFACVLNGAFIPHQRKDHYTMSRGIMALAFLTMRVSMSFLQSLILKEWNLLPYCFTIKVTLKELKWDEEELHVRKLSTEEVHLWSSCTLV